MAVRGTQSFVKVLSECWSRPSLLAIEILWRWLFGAPLLAIVGWQGLHVYATIASRITAAGVDQLSIADPMQTAVLASDIYNVVSPLMLRTAIWLAPIALLMWTLISGAGRNAILRRYDPSLPRRTGALAALQLLRVVFLGGSFWLWFVAIQWAANFSLSGEEPNLVVYCAIVICLSLGIFTLWALVSWVFSIAPLLVLLEGRAIGSSLLRSLRLGSLTGKLIEINLIMGIVKLALVVLAMVFSAVPLPFASVMEGPPLYAWWAIVSIAYLVASDFFQVARLVAFIHLWREYAVPGEAPSTRKVIPVK